jgi:hypothetical protein
MRPRPDSQPTNQKPKAPKQSPTLVRIEGVSTFRQRRPVEAPANVGGLGLDDVLELAQAV